MMRSNLKIILHYIVDSLKKTNHNKVYSAYPSGYAPYTNRWQQLKQMKNFKPVFLTLVTLILASCSNNDAKLELGNGDDVIVNLEVLDSEGITKIEFQANGSVDTVSSEELEKYKTVSFGFDGQGEGTFKVCVFTVSDTICSEHYVEGGYRPELN